ncbi:ParB N-terminal domain-containing protein [Thermogladius sp.]|uniref:ParB N-terminal domain-containing protein n=1 Tax=Thermogladius sp. TaxID=2023064 RepID=UPI003D103BAB
MLKISVEDLDKLHIHEEIIPSILKWLVEKIRSDKVFKDPILVDEKTLVVLDGMHRVAAAKEIGFKYIPVCLVDYDNESIELHAWGRVFAGGDWRQLVDAIKSAGFHVRELDSMEEGQRLLSERRAVGVLVTPADIYVIPSGENDIKKIYDRVKEVESAIESMGFKISYMTEKDSIDAVKSGKAAASLIPPVITKDEVRRVALRGEVFTHKATRHVIPARPMNINVPLEWLTGDLPKDEVNRRVRELLSGKRIRRLPPGTVLDRRYEEELYVFE